MLRRVTGLHRWKPLGWGNRPVRFKHWEEAAEWLAEITASYPPLQPNLDIVESVIVADAQDQLGLVTSMTDLIVIRRHSAEPPYDPVFVNLLPFSTATPERWVRIRHFSFTGHDDQIEVPPSRAVATFGGSCTTSSTCYPQGSVWRFAVPFADNAWYATRHLFEASEEGAEASGMGPCPPFISRTPA